MHVSIEVLPWLSTAVHPGVTGRLALEHDLGGTTVRDLLRELAEADTRFASVVFDLESGEMRYPAVGVVNDSLIEFTGGLDTALVDGDTVTVMAAYTGGSTSF